MPKEANQAAINTIGTEPCHHASYYQLTAKELAEITENQGFKFPYTPKHTSRSRIRSFHDLLIPYPAVDPEKISRN